MTTAPTPTKKDDGEGAGVFFTLAGVKKTGIAQEGDHVSGLKLYVSKKSGTKLHFDFTRDTSKAIHFNDHEAAEQAWQALSMFMGGPLSYQIVKHGEKL